MNSSPPSCELVVDGAGGPVALEDDDGAGRRVLQPLDEAQAFLLEVLDDVLVMDDLAQHSVGTLGILGQQLLQELEGLPDAEAVGQRLG